MRKCVWRGGDCAGSYECLGENGVGVDESGQEEEFGEHGDGEAEFLEESVHEVWVKDGLMARHLGGLGGGKRVDTNGQKSRLGWPGRGIWEAFPPVFCNDSSLDLDKRYPHYGEH